MYKKTLKFTILAVTGAIALIQNTGLAKALEAQTDFGTFKSFGEFANEVFRWGMPTIGSLAVLMFIYAGFLYMTSKGDQANITTAKDIITATIIGLVVLFTAGILMKNVIGMK